MYRKPADRRLLEPQHLRRQGLETGIVDEPRARQPLQTLWARMADSPVLQRGRGRCAALQ
jgi:hypothetical protein